MSTLISEQEGSVGTIEENQNTKQTTRTAQNRRGYRNSRQFRVRKTCKRVAA